MRAFSVDDTPSPIGCAILDRFLHHAELITMKGQSYRLRNKATKEPTKKASGNNAKTESNA